MKLIPNTTNGRWYEVTEGTFVPSVTTIIRGGSPFPSWLINYTVNKCVTNNISYSEFCSEFISEELRVGSLVHKSIEDILTGEKVIVEDDKDVQKSLISFMMWYNQAKPKILHLEIPLFSTEVKNGGLKYPFAGTCDLIAEIDGEKWIIDFKTSKVVDVNMGIQLNAYRMLWNSMFPDDKINKLAIVHCKKNYQGVTPRANTKLFHEFPVDEKTFFYVYNLYALHNESAKGFLNPKIRPEYETEFEIGGKDEISL